MRAAEGWTRAERDAITAEGKALAGQQARRAA
jgi:hypothetical protein